MEPLRFAGKRVNTFELGLARSKIAKIIKRLSYSEGEIDLSSKRLSNYYLDMKPTMFDPEGASLLAELIYNRIEALRPDYIGGMEMGAVPLISPLVILANQNGTSLPGFFVRKERKTHGTRKLIEGVEEGDLESKRVVILDDVTTTGNSVWYAIDAAQNAGAKILLVLSVVDRLEGAVERFAAEKIPFDHLLTIDDVRAA